MPKPNGSHLQGLGVLLTFPEKHGYMEEANKSKPNVNFIKKEEKGLMVVMLGTIDVWTRILPATEIHSRKFKKALFKNCAVGPKRT